MKKLFTLLLSVFLYAVVMAQPEATIKKTDVAPTIDGYVDDVWETVDPIAIDVPFKTETPTVGDSWWKALWDDSGIYLLVYIDDDVFVPAYMGDVPANSWNYDKLEIYFDCNYVKKDGKGATNGEGHYQIAPTEKEAIVNGGTATTEDRGEVWAFNATDNPHYYAEYFVPFSMLLDKDGGSVDKSEPIGFDVNIMDNDVLAEVRNRMNWANAGAIDENWANMDDAGLIHLEGGTSNINIDAITLSGPQEITTDNGTAQLVATIEPADATQPIKWVLTGGTAKVKLSSTGLISAITDGTVLVKAYSSDGFIESNEYEVTVSGQIVDQSDVWNGFNLISNWNFDTDITGWGGWYDGATQIPPVVADGVVVMTTDLNANNEQYHYQFSQSGLKAEPDVPYILRFKTWSDTERSNTVDFEDTEANSYTRYGASSDPEAQGGRSEWHYTVPTEPTWFEFHVTFDQMVESTNQKLQWLQSQAASTVYLDSVLLIKADEFAMSSKELAKVSSMKVYPNPVGKASQLTVSLAQVEGTVAIYNSVGQKVMEKPVESSIVKFDVAPLRKGLYFVKLSDGTTQKFVR